MNDSTISGPASRSSSARTRSCRVPHIAPVLLGDGIRLYDNPGGEPIRLHNLIGDDPHLEVDLRYAAARS
ncbi:hypothetical protein [Nocardioides luteus]|uniref:hypothetical protein n=1 Tax=Nocardioides luteus TaxID=1844 RepID=UPI0018CBB563|nr:hypothetical protein [Nocardioides luteus]MBG6094348.1 hypothetical protein [Nocardioides luteus]